jgi:hypothetical protein
MAGLDNIPESNIPEVKADTTSNVPSAVAFGKNALDPMAAQELLKNMEKFLAERNSPMNRIQQGLEQAAAWAVPNTEGQKSIALNALNTRRNLEADTTFKAQMEMANMKNAIAQNEAFQKMKMAAMTGGGAGGTGGAGATAGGIDPAIDRQLMENSIDINDYRKQKAAYIQAVGKGQIEGANRADNFAIPAEPNAYDLQGNMVRVPPIELQRHPERYRLPGTPMGQPTTSGGGTTQTQPAVSGGAPSFENSVGRLLKTEGGYSAIDGNTGKPVNMGINAKFHPNEDIKGMTKDRATQIYKEQYWNKIEGINNLSQQAADIALDAAANQGPDYANKLVKETGGDPQKMLDHRLARYEATAKGDKTQEPNLQGWKNRIEGFRKELGSNEVAKPTEAKVGNYIIPPPKPTGNITVDNENFRVWKAKNDEALKVKQEEDKVIAKTEGDLKSTYLNSVGGGESTYTQLDNLLKNSKGQQDVFNLSGKGIAGPVAARIIPGIAGQSPNRKVASVLLNEDKQSKFDLIDTGASQAQADWAKNLVQGAGGRLSNADLALGKIAKGVGPDQTYQAHMASLAKNMELARTVYYRGKEFETWNKEHPNEPISKFESSEQYKEARIKAAKDVAEKFRDVPESGYIQKDKNGKEYVIVNGKGYYL